MKYLIVKNLIKLNIFLKRENVYQGGCINWYEKYFFLNKFKNSIFFKFNKLILSCDIFSI